MNHYYSLYSNKDIVFCCIDNIFKYESTSTKQIIKNISDFTISNIVGKCYSVLVSKSEDDLLRQSVNKNYKFAVVFSTGTEFIDGDVFFHGMEEIVSKDMFLAGHILDRKEGYYELHHQCYIINLEIYKNLGCPAVGQQTLNSQHYQIQPIRSSANIHDDYTPVSINPGTISILYNHKAHGYNLISLGLQNDYKIIVFDSTIRSSKKYYYPENQIDFFKHINWVYKRANYCLTEFVHKENNELLDLDDKKFTQILAPASGTKFLKYISNDNVTVTLYDYNQESLNYWKENVPKIDRINYNFLKIDLLIENLEIEKILNTNNADTLINLSNIFCYEATAPIYDLEYRLHKENEILKRIKKYMPESYVYFSTRACAGFAKIENHGNNIQPIEFDQIRKPSWYDKNY